MANKNERVCQVCGKKVSACRNTLRLKPPSGNRENWRQAEGLAQHVINVRSLKSA